MLTTWVVDVFLGLILCVCLAQAEEEEFNVFSTLRKSHFSVNLSKLVHV